MIQYLENIKELISGFEEFTIERLPRSQNGRVDALSKLGSFRLQDLNRFVLVEIRTFKAILEEFHTVFSLSIPNFTKWMDEIVKYKLCGELPQYPRKARKVKVAAIRYCFINGKLYRKSFSMPLLKCVSPGSPK